MPVFLNNRDNGFLTLRQDDSYLFQHLQCTGSPACVFFTIFTKGNHFYDFLFASPENEARPKQSLLFKERICSNGANSYLQELTSLQKKSKRENGRVALHERVPVHHNIITVAMCIFLQDHRTDLEAS